MTANHFQVGVLAVGLLMVLIAIGCSSSDDVISSGDVVMTYPVSTVNPTGVDYQCIVMEYTTLRVKPVDGTCSEASGSGFAGVPCGEDSDCSIVNANCTDTFTNGCDGGPNYNMACAGGLDCPGAACVPRGECANFPGGSFTGAGCFSDLDCTIDSSEKCAGRCPVNSSNPLGACIDSSDCTPGECEGAQIADTLGGSPILLLTAAVPTAKAYFTPNCPACDLNLNSPQLCDQVNPVRCTNLCLPANDVLPLQCVTANCCQQSVLVPIPCDTAEDCEVNQCAESATTIPQQTLPEGKYEITEFRLSNLLMSSFTNGPRPITSCGGVEISEQYDPPLTFELGPGRTNELRFVMDLAELESLLGNAPGANCTNAFANVPSWFQLADN